MGSGVSTRVRKAKAAAEALGAESSPPVAVPVLLGSSAGGDVGDMAESTAGASKMPPPPVEAGKEKDLTLEDVDDRQTSPSSSEDSGSTGGEAERKDLNDADAQLQAKDAQKPPAELSTSGQQAQQAPTEIVATSSRLRDVACQSDCTSSDPPDAPMDEAGFPASLQEHSEDPPFTTLVLPADDQTTAGGPATLPPDANTNPNANPPEAVSEIQDAEAFLPETEDEASLLKPPPQQEKQQLSGPSNGKEAMGDRHSHAQAQTQTASVFTSTKEDLEPGLVLATAAQKPSTSSCPPLMDHLQPTGDGGAMPGPPTTLPAPLPDQQQRPPQVVSSFPGGSEGDGMAPLVVGDAEEAPPVLSSSPLCDVAVREGARPKLMSVFHRSTPGDADGSTKLPAVD